MIIKTIFQINTVVSAGSTGRIVEEIGHLAIRKGWESYIAYGRNERPSKSKLIRISNDIDIKYHGLQTRLFDRHGLASRNSTKRLIEQIEKIQPNIIHLHNLHGYYLNIEILFNFLARANIPVVWTLHDCWTFTGHCVYFDYIGCEKWKTGCFNCPQKKSYPSSILFDRSKQNYVLKQKLFTSVKNLTIIPVSNWLNNIVKDSFLSKYRTQVIHNGIDTSLFKADLDNNIKVELNISDKFIILGVASEWSQRKGLSDFLKLSEHLDFNYQIIIVGLSPTQLIKLPKNIRGIAKTESVAKLAELYSCADIFINPTWEDNFPTTNLESLACGTPVITYKTGGSVESITPETGFIVNKGDILGLVNAIKIIRKNGKHNYSKVCRERAEEFYDKNDRFSDYINIYESILMRSTDNTITIDNY